MGSISAGSRGHVVCVPYPLQGHINPMLKLAKLLHHKGFQVTFVNTQYNHNRLLRSRGPHALDGLPDFCFETIPDGLPPSDADVSQDMSALCVSSTKSCLAPLLNIIHKLNDMTTSSNVPPVTCIVSDGAMSFTLDAAEEFGIPNVLFWTPSSCGILGFMYCRQLVERGLTLLKDESCFKKGFLETAVDWIPGMKNVRLKDLPAVLPSTDENKMMIDFLIRETERSPRASAVVLNTFDPFEKDVLDALSSFLPPIYTIGPLPLHADQIEDDSLKSIGSNLWKEQPGCLEWLNTQEPNSVVFVNFGSITVMTPQQLVEFAWGLANSGKPFLWIIRPDLVVGDSAVLPPEFAVKTKDRCMLASWCPQEQILKHPSIGGFLTHCGWNSTLESVGGGVPMICWPFFADQMMNCRYCCTEWGIGMEIDNNVKRNEVEKLVRELMEGVKGKEMKKKVMEWKTKAEEAVKPGGSSHQNLDKLIADVLLPGNV
ncbi:7-deoxyloganetin glucosyltransferase-like [Juglans microcarpa x Juglans regia]|uniref:7-deoxyloganetin glucosyltransferase-like n=1 Tax=Juglans microcarpa x Juglans regia TaxID=2249226 RepID=UPI001B7E2CDE|nr:7-deoxyloganetin glucosyltransferase-like [Juglans microcarpa x Juglans regia]